MADSRTKNASRNMAFGILNKLVSLLIPFVTRTIIIKLLGEMYLGIGSLFSSVLNFLSLTELGLGSAIVYAMYEPVALGKHDVVCGILNYYKRLYRLIGTGIMAIGTVLVPLIPFLIKGDAPANTNVYILYYIYLINAAVSYFFAGYRQSLLLAHQRTDVSNKIHTFVVIAVNAGQILALYFTRNFYVYAFVPILGSLITNICLAVLTRKMYPHLDCRGQIQPEIKKELKKKLVGLFGTKLNSIVVHSADVMVISAFLGLSVTARYSNYYYILNAICGFVMVLFSSMTAGIGNKLVMDSLEENYGLFKNISFMNAWLVGFCCACFLCLYEPFMTVWVGSEMRLGIGFVILLVCYFFVYEIQRTILAFKDAAGLWYEDRLRPYISMALNVISNLVMVQFLGIYGIVLSSILAFLISVPWVNAVLFKSLFRMPPHKNLLRMLGYLAVTVLACAVSYGLCSFCHEGFWGLAERLGICLIVPNGVFWLCFGRTKEFAYALQKVKKLLRLNKSKG